MRISQQTSVKIFDQAANEWQDITNGILSIDTMSGSDSFQGFWDQPDTGQFVITSRGATSDPQLHSYIKTNALIEIKVADETVFAGFITDVNVQYNKNDKQIVTINGTDLIGYLNRLVITQDFIDSEITPTYADGLVPVDYLLEVCTYALAPEVKAFFYINYTSKEQFVQLTDPTSFPGVLPDAPKVKVEIGKTLYELIARGMSSGLMRYECVYGNQYYFMPYYKYDYSFYSTFWDNWYTSEYMTFARTNESDPWQSEPGTSTSQITYKQIRLSNGLDKMINQVSVNNVNPATQESLSIETLANQVAVEAYGPASLYSDTTFTTTTNPFFLPTSTIAGQAAEYQNNILDYQSEPSTTINSVVLDMAKYYEVMQYPFNGGRIFIQHRLDNDEYITGQFVISGVRNRITDSEWTTELILRKSEYALYQDSRPKTPEITLNATSGDTNDTFTASIGNYTSEDWANVARVEWMLNYPGNILNSMPGTPPSQFATEYAEFFGEDLPLFTTNTVSWNYDDGGALSGYNPEFYGPGVYSVVVWITNNDGYVTSSYTDAISISSAAAHADFIFSKDAAEAITFTDMSGSDTNTWSWNFGDGTTYSGQNPPVKTYAASGTYTISLTVDNGFNTNTITKPVTVNIYQLEVQYIRLRYQGEVTKPAGASDYTTDLIDTIGLVELKNTVAQQTGGIQPMYVHVRTAEKVQDIGKGNNITSVSDQLILDSYSGTSTYSCSTDPRLGKTKYDVYAVLVGNQVGGEIADALYDNGTNGVGATITFFDPITTIDGIPVSSISGTVKILFMLGYDNQVQGWLGKYNGVYTFNASNPTVLTRATDFDQLSEVNPTYDMYFEVQNGNYAWKPTTTYPQSNPPFIWRYSWQPTEDIVYMPLSYGTWNPPYELSGTYYEDVVNHTGSVTKSGTYTPYYSTNYNSGGPLDPMSQSMRTDWNDAIVRGTVGGDKAKFKFHPVITTNPDGSETKSIDVDLIIWYSQTYIGGTSSTSSTSAWRDWNKNLPAGSTTGMSYLPSGTTSRLAYWSNWGGSGAGYGERLKLKEVKIWPGLDQTVISSSAQQVQSTAGIDVCPPYTIDIGYQESQFLDKYGIQSGKTYLPISISVSEDGSTYRKIGEATYTSGSVMETTYTAEMPPYSNAPIES